MNPNERLKENRREYSNNFLLGFFGGKGLISVIILAVFSFFKFKPTKDKHHLKNKDEKGPEQFDIIE